MAQLGWVEEEPPGHKGGRQCCFCGRGCKDIAEVTGQGEAVVSEWQGDEGVAAIPTHSCVACCCFHSRDLFLRTRTRTHAHPAGEKAG